MLKKISTITVVSLMLLASAVVPTYGEVDFLKGKVHYLDQSGRTLQQRMDAVEKEFGGEDVQNELLFVLSAHETPEVGDFLKKTAFRKDAEHKDRSCWQ